MFKALSVDTVRKVITLARVANPPAKNDSLDLSDLNDEQLVNALKMTPEEKALRDYMKNLPEDQLAELMALMWLGRAAGGEQKRDYPELVKYAKEQMDHAASYMAEKAPLAEYLSDGLKKLKP